MKDKSRKQLYDELKRHPEGKAAALDLLGEDARQWWAYRQQKNFSRLVDPNSGKWVSEFEAGGKRYYIRSPKDGVGMRRYIALRQYLSEVGFDAALQDQRAALNRIVDHANTIGSAKPRLSDMFLEIDNMRKAIEKTERDWHFSYRAAAVFIVTKDEDLSKWSEGLIEEKANAWNDAGYHEHDFFLLAMLWASRSIDLLNESLETVQRMAAAIK